MRHVLPHQVQARAKVQPYTALLCKPNRACAKKQCQPKASQAATSDDNLDFAEISYAPSTKVKDLSNPMPKLGDPSQSSQSDMIFRDLEGSRASKASTFKHAALKGEHGSQDHRRGILPARAVLISAVRLRSCLLSASQSLASSICAR